ncbi:MAG: monofunctional biosynthetic peptidoglycan transglycosylase [Bacteroidales bacterium]|jgi:monofunctional biosynthetic peptidoglycan transglycosylase|nr:monofunctional biosynthetic peptidoglycan transglycosylase [Bacteroidales bacterium]
MKKKKNGKTTSGKNSKKTPLKKGMFFVLKLLLFFFVLSLVIPLLYRWVNPPVTFLMLQRKFLNGYAIQKEWKSLEQISPTLYQCAVAAEDNNFLGHRGFDFGAIQKALDERESGKRKRGASTISQQTAKNVFLFPQQSWVRKGAEVYFTFLIETFWSKERIMEVYLNVIEMGEGIYGAEAASRTFFHKAAADLTLRQSALITATYPDPLHRSPVRPTSYLSNRADKIAQLSQKIGPVKFDKASLQKARERYLKRENKRVKKNDGKWIDISR